MERNRIQAEQGQAKMMEQHTKLLEQIAARPLETMGPNLGVTYGRRQHLPAATARRKQGSPDTGLTKAVDR